MLLPKISKVFKDIGIQVPIIIAIHFVLIFGILFYSLVQGYQINKTRTEDYARLLGTSLVNQHFSIMEEASLVLESWATILEENSSLSATSFCNNSVLNLSVEHKERYTTYGAVDDSYKIICNSDPLKTGISVVEREYILKVFSEKTLTTSGYLIGLTTGEPSINLGYPVLNEAGEVTDALVLAISIDWVNDLISSMPLPQFYEIWTLDNKGLILTEYPSNGTAAGKPLFSDRTFQSILSGNKDNLEVKEPDGTTKMYIVEPIFVTTKDKPDAFVVVGVPKKSMLEEINNLRNKITGLILLTFGVEFFIVLLFSWNISKRKALTEQPNKKL